MRNVKVRVNSRRDGDAGRGDHRKDLLSLDRHSQRVYRQRQRSA